MPVSVITDVVTWIEMIAQIGVTTLELGVLNYLVFGGGWLDMIRLISFWLDNMIIKYTDVFYSYFEKILGGQIFAPNVVDGVMNKVYIFVSLFVLLKLIMLFIKYLINPEMVSDDKIGTHALVRRVILGMCGLLFLPFIFNFSVEVQEAVLNDNLFGQILLDKSDLRTFEKNKGQVGRVLAFNVHQAFWNLDENRVTDSKIKKEYANAQTAKDPGVISNINEKFGEDYAYDYFPIASTVVLLYVIYLIIKYCIDVVVRMFKLFLLQMLGPLAISDYMINGDSKDVFRNWMKTTISVYAMLFVRIFSIWFIAFITILMSRECGGDYVDGVCSDSLLYIPQGGSPDYLLRGIITLGLLALLMDLPKFFSDILGLDLEQDASVKGLMQKVGGAAKMVGMGGLAVGGAAIGGAIGTAKALGGTVSKATGLSEAMQKSRAKRDGILNKAPGLGNLRNAAKEANLGEHHKAAMTGVFAAAMNSNSITGTAYKGATQATSEQKQVDQKSRDAKDKQRADELQEAQMKSMNVTKDDAGNVIDASQNIKIDPTSIAALAGATQAVSQANGESQTVQAGRTTVEVGDIDVKVTGKAIANYDGGLETTITGKATTTYNGDLETEINGNAVAKYNNDLNVEVNGNATATYNNDFNVEMNGNANATLNKDLNVEINGNATATYSGDVDTLVEGNTTAIVEGNVETVIEKSTKIDMQEVDISRKNKNDA